MLVRNSTSLREEIYKNLRAEYINLIRPQIDQIEKRQHELHYAGHDLILNLTLGSNYYSFSQLKNVSIGHEILAKVESATIVLTDDVFSTKSETFSVTMFSENELKLYVNDPFIYNLKDPTIIPSYDINYSIGTSIEIILGKKDNMNEVWLKTNIIPKAKKDYDNSETQFLTPILEELHRIKIEHTHYMSIVSYFNELFEELPSLNQMHRACPTIINYVSRATKENLFKNIKGKNEDRLDDLKPSGEVALALARSKLRGKR
jgi:hypothetical protein